MLRQTIINMKEISETPNLITKENILPDKKTMLLAGAATASIQGTYKIMHTPEVSNQSNIHLEPGIPAQGDGIAKTINIFQAQNPNASLWTNAEAFSQRIDYHPQIITVPILTPINPSQPPNKEIIWLMSPGRPKKINTRGFNMIIADSGSYPNIAINALEALEVSPNPETYYHLNQLSAFDTLNEVYNNYFYYQKRLTNTRLITSVSAGLALYFTPESNPKKSITRREFTRLATGVSAYFAADNLFNYRETQSQENAPIKASLATSQDQKLEYQIDSHVPDIPPHISTEGRTALLTEKHLAAAKLLQDRKLIEEKSSGSIVLEPDQLRNAPDYLNDPKSRAQAIFTFAQMTINRITSVLERQYRLNDGHREIITESIINHLAAYEIYHIQDPNEPGPRDMLQYIEANIKPRGRHTSEEILQTLSPLKARKKSA